MTVEKHQMASKEAMAASEKTPHEPAPPPYSPPSSSSSSSSPIRFPVEMNYNDSHISPGPYLYAVKGQPLNLVRTVPSKTMHILHSGPSEDSPPIATVAPQKRMLGARRSVIQVPSTPGGVLSDGNSIEIVMDGDKRDKHPFTIPLDDGSSEEFEWRNTRGDEIRNLSGEDNQGWKLVRLNGPPAVPGRADPLGRTSDGKEVVALAAYPCRNHKNAKLVFMGAGASGQLGQTFEIVAAVSFFRMFQLAVLHMTRELPLAGAGAVGSM